MSGYSITLSDQQEAGVTAACKEYNDARPDDDPLTNAGYVQMVMRSAADSYVNAYVKTDLTREQVAVLVKENEELKAAVADKAVEAVPLKP
jgi:hypothetical protein